MLLLLEKEPLANFHPPYKPSHSTLFPADQTRISFPTKFDEHVKGSFACLEKPTPPSLPAKYSPTKNCVHDSRLPRAKSCLSMQGVRIKGVTAGSRPKSEMRPQPRDPSLPYAALTISVPGGTRLEPRVPAFLSYSCLICRTPLPHSATMLPQPIRHHSSFPTQHVPKANTTNPQTHNLCTPVPYTYRQ
jgi:hypothetical protein